MNQLKSRWTRLLQLMYTNIVDSSVLKISYFAFVNFGASHNGSSEVEECFHHHHHSP